MSALKVEPGRAALLVVDVQDRLAQAMAPELRERCVKNILLLVEMARRARMPVVLSEQYPKGLGPTTPAIAEAVAAPDVQLHRFEKVEFSCAEAPAFAPIWDRLGRDQWIVTGMETHICVYQSARGLLDRGARVQVVRDAVASRTAENLAVGLDLIGRAGGVVTSTETVVFDVLNRAGTDDFRALSKLVK